MCRSQQVALGEEGPLGAAAVAAGTSSLPALRAPSLPWAVDSAPPCGPGPLPSVLGVRSLMSPTSVGEKPPPWE